MNSMFLYFYQPQKSKMLKYQYNIYSLLYFITAVISVFSSLFALRNRRAPGGMTLFILLLLTAWWCIGGLFESAADDVSLKFTWSGLEYIGGVNVPVLLLILTIQYCYGPGRIRNLTASFLFVVPALTVLAALTNNTHHLVWTGYLSGPAGSNQIIYQHGPWFWIGFMGYSYLMMASSLVVLISAMIQQKKTFRYQIIALLSALALPWICNILYLLNYNPLPGLDITRIAFSGSGIILVFSMTAFHFLDLIPKARTLLIETMKDGMVVIDPTGRILDINPSAKEIMGIDPKENLIGKSLNAFPESNLTSLQAAVAEDASQVVYFFSPKYIEINIQSLLNKKEEVTAKSIYLHDVTEIKKKEKEIQQSEEKYRILAENVSDVIWMVDMDMRYLYVSPSVENQRGYSVKEFISLKPEEVYVPESLALINSKIPEYVKLSMEGKLLPGTSLIIELQHRCKNGSIKTGEVHANAVLDEHNRLVAIHGITRDITSRKIEESALKQRDKLLHSITRAVISLLQRSDIEIAIAEALQILGEAINGDRVYIFENVKDPRTFEAGMRLRHQWTNEPRVQPRSEEDQDFIPYYDSFQRWYDRLSNGKSISGPVDEFPDIERIALSTYSVKSVLVIPIFIEAGFWGFIGFDDCNERRIWSQAEENVLNTAAVIIGTAYVKKRTEIDLIRAKEQAEESDRLKSAFLATMSHELRTPLNAIIGFSGIMHTEMEQSDLEEYIKIIHQSGKNLLNIIEDLFNISMIESGDIRVELEHFTFEKFRNELNEILFTEIKNLDRPNLAIHYSPDPAWPDLFLFSDQAKLLQIFSNILRNAVKFTIQGSVEYGYRVGNGKEVTFFVKDTGIGIAPELQKVVFEKFRQADETFTRKYGGTGLGLSISKRLTELLNGNIWVESVPGSGSTFYIMLPCRDLGWQASKNKAGNGLEFLRNKTILLVEDEESNYLLIKTIMKHSEAKIFWAQNGKEAVEQIDTNNEISIVLMDIKMPVMDGYEAARISKTLRPKLPVIALTAHALYGDEEKAFKSGFDNYIPKPINKNLLFSVLEQYLY
jgi:PAS domain S-box-containing protein